MKKWITLGCLLALLLTGMDIFAKKINLKNVSKAASKASTALKRGGRSLTNRIPTNKGAALQNPSALSSSNAVLNRIKGPEMKSLQSCVERSVARLVRRTPQEWLKIIEPWVLEHKRWPSAEIEEEKNMYQAVAALFRYRPEDPAVVRLRVLKDQWGERASRITENIQNQKVSKDAGNAAKLAEDQLGSPELVTQQYIENLMQFYNKLDPFQTGFIGRP